MSTPEPTLEERIRALYDRLGIAPVTSPAPPPDAPPPPRPWSESDDEDEESGR